MTRSYYLSSKLVYDLSTTRGAIYLKKKNFGLFLRVFYNIILLLCVRRGGRRVQLSSLCWGWRGQGGNDVRRRFFVSDGCGGGNPPSTRSLPPNVRYYCYGRPTRRPLVAVVADVTVHLCRRYILYYILLLCMRVYTFVLPTGRLPHIFMLYLPRYRPYNNAQSIM